MDTTAQTTGIDWSGWFDRVNGAALTWYGIYQQNQPATTQPTIQPTRGGGLTISLPLLIVGAVVVIGAVYIYKKS
jgi:hypothetical protein